MSEKTTREQLLERYHTYGQRLTIEDERHKALVFKAYRRLIGPWLPQDRTATILDVACGEGTLLAFLRERGYTNLSGFDLSPENVAICRQLSLPFVQQFDALRLKEFPGLPAYDVIFAFDILEHLPKPRAAEFLEQVRERLSPGGVVVLQTPNMGSWLGWHIHYADLTHEWGVTERSLADLLVAAGFSRACVMVYPAWSAATWLGRVRESYLALLHRLVFLSEDSNRPGIPTKNLLAIARRSP